jgi:formyltetrahydrofolate-dependent phosphoribosylglycinamide formyltransferase
MSARIAVLASGGGSNLQSLFDHLDRLGARRGGEVVLVASDRASAGALDRARHRGVEALVVEAGDGRALDAALRDREIDLLALAGYLRFVPPLVTRRLRGRMVNVHPALLPAFGGVGMYGLRVHQAVLDAGSRVTGATVHFVDDTYDHGPIIAQWPVAVHAGDTAQTLAARVLRIEHLLFPRVVDAVAAGRITLGADDRVHGGPPLGADDTLALSLESDAAIAERLDTLLGDNPSSRLAARTHVGQKPTAKSR